MLTTLSFLLMLYLKNAVVLYLLFVAFNAVLNGAGFTKKALILRSVEKKIVLTAPIAYVLISILFSGFMASILSIIAFVLIYAYYTKRF